MKLLRDPFPGIDEHANQRNNNRTQKNFGQDYNLFNRGTPICHDKAINILSRMFVREVMTCAILPILEEMPFKKFMETVSCFRHLYDSRVSNRKILVSELKT